mmetsp:Transcript_7370/g.22134  ORF Transcript_7370/g.22134 Transcript_7370/m.22134 type:complete len:238 (+) Transcript_7370:853-1566(+)|eukprot:scaffold2621_cov31-Tisochrysis_lutea.AAC.5
MDSRVTCHVPSEKPKTNRSPCAPAPDPTGGVGSPEAGSKSRAEIGASTSKLSASSHAGRSQTRKVASSPPDAMMPRWRPSGGVANARAAPPTLSPSASPAADASPGQSCAWPRVMTKGSASVAWAGGTSRSSEARVPISSPSPSAQSSARSLAPGARSCMPRSTPARSGWLVIGERSSVRHIRTAPSLPQDSRLLSGPSTSTCTGPSWAALTEDTSRPFATSKTWIAPEAEPTAVTP